MKKMMTIALLTLGLAAVLTLTIKGENGEWKWEVTSLIARWLFDEHPNSKVSPKISGSDQKNGAPD